MKRILLAALAFSAIACSTPKPTDKVLVAGSFWDSIAIVNKTTGDMEWAMALPSENGRPECNTISLTKNGDILFSYKKGARLINRQGATIWDYKTANDSAELQTAIQLPDGNFMVAICDNPTLIAELDSTGKTIKETKVNLNIATPHAQFRAVSKSSNGNYLIPIITQGKVLEISQAGDTVNTYNTGGVPFSLVERANGNLLVSCGDSHSLVEVDRTTGEATTLVGQKDVEGANFQFVAGAALLPNGNIMVTNWLGHVDGPCDDLQIVEFDPAKKLVWSFKNRALINNVSVVFPFSE